MVGSPALSSAVVHQRRHMNALWSSSKFIDLAKIWKGWTLLTSISVRSLRPLTLIAWPASLETLPGRLQHLRFEFRHCIELFLCSRDLKEQLPVLETLELIDPSKQSMLKRLLSLAGLPPSLRTLRLKTQGNSAISREDLLNLPTTLEVLDCDLWMLENDAWVESEAARFAAEVRLPPSLTYLQVNELFSHLTSLPSSLTHLHIEHGDILDFLDNPDASSLLQPDRNKFSLRTMFPGLKYLHFGLEIATSYALLKDLPASLTHIVLGEWGAVGPREPYEVVLKMLKSHLKQITHFQANIDHPYLRRLTSLMPELKSLKIMLVDAAESNHLWYPSGLTKLEDDHVAIDKLPTGLLHLGCYKVQLDYMTLFEQVSNDVYFPRFLQSFRSMSSRMYLTVDFVNALPPTLTDLQISIGDSEDVWRALSRSLTSLTHLEASDSDAFSGGLPPSATLLPRKLRHLTISGTADSATLLPYDTKLFREWFRDGLASLDSLESLIIAGSVVHQDVIHHLPPQLKSLCAPAYLVNAAELDLLPRHLETLKFNTPLTEITAAQAALLPPSLTNLQNQFADDPHRIANALPPFISLISSEKTAQHYYVRKKVLGASCDPVLLKIGAHD